MADQITVKYASMAAGSAAMTSATNRLRGHADDMLAAANAAAPHWDAQSHAAFRSRHARILSNVAEIENIVRAHASAVDSHSASTAQLDNSLAAQFDA